MIRHLVFSIVFVALGMAQAQDVSRSLQMQYPRVAEAFREKQSGLNSELQQKGCGLEGYNLILAGYKLEKKLEVYIAPKGSRDFTLFKSYDFCVLSGELGPKRKEGDFQVPEGLYQIDRFNPSSNFHLSLGLNYPNASDKILSDKKKPGGEIFIHGNCVSVGCIPITDEFIKELYILCVEAMDGGQSRIPVYLFPCKMTEENMTMLELMFRTRPELVGFWKNLKNAYDRWDQSKKPLKYSVSPKGEYLFS